jgi:molecular chaperone GrpE
MKGDGGLFGKKVPKEKYQQALDDLAKAQADSDHWKNEYYRAYADMQNLRKSLEEEHRTALRYRSEGFLENLLPALDGFHLALDNPPKSEETKNYLVGFSYIYNQIEKVLEDEGVSEIAPKVGDAYDLNTMHAVDTVPSDGEPGRVLKVYTKGYKLYDRLIRPVMVSVSAAKAKEEPKKPDEAKEAAAPEAPLDQAHKA